MPPAVARTGAFIGKNVVMMPSYVNIGAYVDEGTMVDTWATVGSCAQIGKNVHLSGGVGIGGVLEPLQANPTIIEDGCFIGARSEVVEGSSSRRIRCSRWECSSVRARRSTTGRPARSLRPGAIGIGRRPRKPAFIRRQVLLSCAVIVKRVDAQTRQDVHQRAAARVTDIQAETLRLASSSSPVARSRPPTRAA